MEGFIIIIAAFVFFVVLIVVFIFSANKYGKQRIENIKSLKQKQRFEYLDFFFYTRVYKNADIDNPNWTRHYGFFVIRDLETSKIYAINKDMVNANFRFTQILTKDKIDLSLNSKQNVNFGDKGYFWIDYELHDITFLENGTVNINNEITLKYYAGNIENMNNFSSEDVLYNLNPKYDISLLKKAIFISGIVEFDVKDI